MSITTIQSDSFSPKHPVVLRSVCLTILNTKEGIPDMNCDIQWLPLTFYTDCCEFKADEFKTAMIYKQIMSVLKTILFEAFMRNIATKISSYFSL